MAFLYRPRYPESSYETWKDAFQPYLSEMYELMVRRLPSGYRPLYGAFCSFVYHFSSKEIPDVFFQELDERTPS